MEYSLPFVLQLAVEPTLPLRPPTQLKVKSSLFSQVSSIVAATVVVPVTVISY
jgi:hypothetical protein